MRIRHPFPLLTAGALLAVLSVLTTGPVAALAATTPADAPPLGLIALDQAGSFFDTTISPGESLSFEVERVNPTDSAVEAQTYVGMVSTIVNGGFGAGEATAAVSGASTWVDYPAGTLALAPLERSTAAFTVTVPADAAPGQYVSSIVLENSAPGAGAGQIALDRRVRTAVAVSIRVPGDLAPAFSLGRATLEQGAGSQVVTVEASNTGNQHLAPAGTLTVTGADAAVISTTELTMGSIYAGTSTEVSVMLDSPLAPGDYTMTLTLADPLTGVEASVVDAPLSIAAPDLFAQLTEPLTGLLDLSPKWAPLLIVLLVVGFIGFVAMSVFGFVTLNRRRQLPTRRMPTSS